jgi:hypothetical protein
MNYTKPEVAVLGKAAVVIESTISPKGSGVFDLGQMTTKAATPAYDLDE